MLRPVAREESTSNKGQTSSVEAVLDEAAGAIHFPASAWRRETVYPVLVKPVDPQGGRAEEIGSDETREANLTYVPPPGLKRGVSPPWQLPAHP